VALAAPSVAQTPDVAAADPTSKIDAYLAPYLADGHLSGTLLVAKEGAIVYERSFGMANYELKVPNTPSTRFCVASITKPMTIAVISQLVGEGLLETEDPVSKWIPDFPRGDEITVSHLLNHRAGIAHRVTTDEDEGRPLTPAEVVERVKASELIFEPGEKSVYSSAGYTVLARIIELVTGEPYGVVMERRLFTPTGMRHSVHPDFPHLIPDRATSYVPSLDGVLSAPLKDLSFLAGAGSVFSTPSDLHAMIRALLDGKLGDTAKQALLRETGLSWNGITNGYRAFADYHADSGVEVVFAGNLNTGAVNRLRADVPKIMIGESVATPARIAVKPVEVDEKSLRRFEGVYESDRGQSFPIHVERGMIFAGDRLLIPTSETSFYSLQEYGRVNVILDDDGNVERLDWEWGGQFWPYHFRKGLEE